MISERWRERLRPWGRSVATLVLGAGLGAWVFSGQLQDTGAYLTLIGVLLHFVNWAVLSSSDDRPYERLRTIGLMFAGIALPVGILSSVGLGLTFGVISAAAFVRAGVVWFKHS